MVNLYDDSYRAGRSGDSFDHRTTHIESYQKGVADRNRAERQTEASSTANRPTPTSHVTVDYSTPGAAAGSGHVHYVSSGGGSLAEVSKKAALMGAVLVAVGVWLSQPEMSLALVALGALLGAVAGAGLAVAFYLAMKALTLLLMVGVPLIALLGSLHFFGVANMRPLFYWALGLFR